MPIQDQRDETELKRLQPANTTKKEEKQSSNILHKTRKMTAWQLYCMPLQCQKKADSESTVVGQEGRQWCLRQCD